MCKKMYIIISILAVAVVVLSFVAVSQNEKLNRLEAEVLEYMEINNELWNKNLDMWNLQTDLNDIIIDLI